MAERKYISYIKSETSFIWVPVEYNGHLDKLDGLAMFLSKYSYSNATVREAGFVTSLGGNASHKLAIPREHRERDGHYFILLEDTAILRKLISVYPFEDIPINKTRWEIIS